MIRKGLLEGLYWVNIVLLNSIVVDALDLMTVVKIRKCAYNNFVLGGDNHNVDGFGGSRKEKVN